MGSTNPIRITTSVDLAGLTQYNAAVGSIAVANEKAAASFAAPIAASREFAAEIATVASSNERNLALFNDAAAAATNEGYSIREARGSARLMAEELGLHLNRELADTVARSSIVGPVLEKAFSVFAIVGFLEIFAQIPSLIEKAAGAITGWDAAAKKSYEDIVRGNLEAIRANLALQKAIDQTSLIGLEGSAKYAAELKLVQSELHNSGIAAGQLQQEVAEMQVEMDKIKPPSEAVTKFGQVFEFVWNNLVADDPLARALDGDNTRLDELTEKQKAFQDLIKQLAKDEKDAADVKTREVHKHAAEDAAKEATATAQARIEAQKSGDDARIAYEESDYRRQYELQQISLEQEISFLQKAEERKLAIEIKASEDLKRLKLSEAAATPGKNVAPDIERINAQEVAAQLAASTKIQDLAEQLQVALRRQDLETLDAEIRNAKELAEAKKHLSEQTARDLNDDAKRAAEDARRIYEENFASAEKAANRELEMQTRLHRDSISAKREDLAAWYSELTAALDKELAAARKNGYESADDYRRLILRKEDLDKEYADKKKAIDDKIVAAEEKTLTTIGNAFNGAVGQWIGGDKKFGAAMAEEWNKLLTTATDNILKIGEQWLIGLILHKSAAEQDILVSAKTAAAGAYAAMAPIPIVGPELGAIAAAVTFAAVAALGSFEQGGIVPSTGSAMLHGGEMVLPAHISNFIQQAAGEGGGSSSTSSTTNHYHTSVQFHNHAGNSRDVLSAENELVRAIAKATRRGRIGQ